MRLFPALLSSILIPLVTLSPVMAQIPDPSPAPQNILRIQAVDTGTPDRIAVQVTDAAGNRIPDAVVIFRLPDGATFANGAPTATVTTGADGIAQMQGIQRSAAIAGTIRVTASKGSAHAGLLIENPSSQTPTAANPTATPGPQPPAAVPNPVPAAEPPAAPETPEPALPKRTPVEKAAPQPGIVVVQNDDSPYANVPIRPLVAEAAGGSLSPKLSIVSSGRASSDHGLRNKLLIGLAVAAGAGAAFALTRSSHASSSSSGISIGSPIVSVGHP